jgi:hypothetical protein
MATADYLQKFPVNATLPPLFTLTPPVTRLALGRRVVASRPQGARRAPPCQPEPASLRSTAAPSVTACTRSALTAAPSACRRAWSWSEPLAPNPRRCCAPALPRRGLKPRQRLRPWLVAHPTGISFGHNLQNSGLDAAGGWFKPGPLLCRPLLSPLHRHPPATARLMAAPSSACAEQAATGSRARALKACLVQALNITPITRGAQRPNRCRRRERATAAGSGA